MMRINIDEQFKVIKPYVIDLDSGRFSDSPNNFDQLKLTRFTAFFRARFR